MTEEATAERAEATANDAVPEVGAGRLRQLVAYGRKTYDLRERLAGVRDARQRPKASAAHVAAAILFCGLLRVRSLNALEPKLREKSFLRLLDAPPMLDALCSADTVSRALRVMELGTVQRISRTIVAQAERNKVFREGWHGALRYVAIDGWEPFCSYNRHCDDCLVRLVKVKQRDGTVIEVAQYYHRYVVAMLLDKRFDLALDIEPLLTNEQRPQTSLAAQRGADEGELTAAIRLLRRVKQKYSWIDVVVGDALYANGVFLTVVQQLRMGAVVTAKKEGDEPLREALNLWQGKPPDHVEDVERLRADGRPAGRERVELWDCRDLETLDTYAGPIRVVRAKVTDLAKPDAPTTTWCILATGVAAKRLSAAKVLAVGRGRWHIENTGFHQWTTRWYFEHVFVRDGPGMLALYWLFFAAYNLLTLFLYRQLRSYGRDRGNDVTRTISRLIDEMNDDLARLTFSPWDTS